MWLVQPQKTFRLAAACWSLLLGWLAGLKSRQYVTLSAASRQRIPSHKQRVNQMAAVQGNNDNGPRGIVPATYIITWYTYMHECTIIKNSNAGTVLEQHQINRTNVAIRLDCFYQRTLTYSNMIEGLCDCIW